MMQGRLNENKTLVILLGILLLVILGALYYYVLYPKIERNSQIADSIQRLTIENHQLKQDIMSFEEMDDDATNIFELRKKLPATRGVSELLLALEEAELVSEASIQSIVFNNYDGLVSESGYGVTDQEELAETNETVEDDAREDGDEEVPETKIDVEALPATLKLLSFSLDVEVQDYTHLLMFIREIEAIERIKRIEDISFTQGGEAELQAVDADETMVMTLQVTTFYSEEEVS